MISKLFICTAAVLAATIINAQDGNKIFTKVEITAGTNEKAWAEHIKKNTVLPDSVLKNIPPGTYKIEVQFIVDVHGSLGQVKAKNDPGFGLAERAVNIISTYKGEWQPANQCGRNVKSYRIQPIVFVIEN